MDFRLTEEQELVKRTARDFATAEVLPKAAEIDREHRHPSDLVKRMAELGFLGIAVPDEYGGAGYGLYRTALLSCLRFRGLTLAVVIGLFAVSLWGFGYVDQSFFPNSTRPQRMVDFWLPQGTRIADPRPEARHV